MTGYEISGKLDHVVVAASDPMYVLIKMQNGSIVCLVDSRASMSIMSMELCKKLKLEDQLESEQR